MSQKPLRLHRSRSHNVPATRVTSTGVITKGDTTGQNVIAMNPQNIKDFSPRVTMGSPLLFCPSPQDRCGFHSDVQSPSRTLARAGGPEPGALGNSSSL